MTSPSSGAARLEKRWLRERLLFWLPTRFEIAAFSLTKRRRGYGRPVPVESLLDDDDLEVMRLDAED